MRTTACLVLKETLHGRGISLSRRRWHVPMHWTSIERSMNHWQCLHHRFNPIDHVDPFPTQTHARMRTQQRSIITINAAFFQFETVPHDCLTAQEASFLPSFLFLPPSFLYSLPFSIWRTWTSSLKADTQRPFSQLPCVLDLLRFVCVVSWGIKSGHAPIHSIKLLMDAASAAKTSATWLRCQSLPQITKSGRLN